MLQVNAGDLLLKRHGFLKFGNSAFFEEMLFRLIVFKLIEGFTGSWRKHFNACNSTDK